MDHNDYAEPRSALPIYRLRFVDDDDGRDLATSRADLISVFGAVGVTREGRWLEVVGAAAVGPRRRHNCISCLLRLQQLE